MRRFAASLLLLTYLFANTEFHELAKIGAFIEHYAQHQKENKNLNLLDFIVLHYFSGNVVDDDYAEDMQLPFKTADCSQSVPTVIIPVPDFLDVNPSVLIKSRALLPYDQSLLPSSHLDDIWHPPKAC
jgi:hypothetical protein